MIGDLRKSTGNDSLLKEEFERLEAKLNEIISEFDLKLNELSLSLDRAMNRLDEFSMYAQDILPEHNPVAENFMRGVDVTKRNATGHTMAEREALLARLQPTLSSLVGLRVNDYHLTIPENLNKSFLFLSVKIQSKEKALSKAIEELQEELEKWFRNSITLAQISYQRNWLLATFAMSLVFVLIFNINFFYIGESIDRSQIFQSGRNEVFKGVYLNGQECSQKATGSVEAKRCFNEMNDSLSEIFSEANLAPQFSRETLGKASSMLPNIFGWLISVLIVSAISAYILSGRLEALLILAFGKK